MQTLPPAPSSERDPGSAARADLPEGYRRAAFDTLGSTNAEARARARAGDPGRLWVTARVQSAGYGRRGRGWSTDAGNLAASVLLLDPASPEACATLAFVAGVALHQAAVDLLGPATTDRLRLKWPNDLLLDGLKVAGILIEGEKLAAGGFAVVVGCGVNCSAHPELSGPVPATDFAAQGLPVAVEDMFGALARAMASEITIWDRGSGFPAIRSAWLARCTGIGQTIRVNLPGRSFEGRFDTLDAEGRLVVAHPGGSREAISTGDVFFAVGG